MTDRKSGLELVWPGKYDAAGRRTAIPRVRPALETIEIHGAGDDPDRLIVGDNLLVLDALADAHAGTVDLAYIDPPFGTGGRFDVQSPVGPRGEDGKTPRLRLPAYGDRWDAGPAGLVAMLDPRLRLLHALLAPTGSLYVHLDATVVHAVKLLLDEIFGPECFQREIVWRIGWVSGFKTKAKNWIRNHDVILFYTKDPSRFVFEKQYVPHPPGYVRRDGAPARAPGMPMSDVWNGSDVEAALRGPDSLDSIQIKSFSGEKTGYATQKNESLLRRIVTTSSRPGDLVADVFCGSGTTLAVAKKLGRRVLGCDSGRAAIHIARRRLLAVESERPLHVQTIAAHERAMHRDPAIRPDAFAAIDDLPPGAEPIVAWGFRVPAPIRERADGSIAVGGAPKGRGPTLRVAQRESFDARTAGAPTAVTSLARIEVRLRTRSGGRIGVELVGLHDPEPSEELAALARTSLDLVDAWAVEWHAVDDVLRPASFVQRHVERRDLQTDAAHDYEGPGPFRLRVVVFDVLHRTAKLECTLARDGDTLAVREAWAG